MLFYNLSEIIAEVYKGKIWIEIIKNNSDLSIEMIWVDNFKLSDWFGSPNRACGLFELAWDVDGSMSSAPEYEVRAARMFFIINYSIILDC